MLELEMTRGTDLIEEWRAFDSANPHVWDALVSKAREIKALGQHRTVSFRMIFEVVRFETEFTNREDSGTKYRLDNNYISIYNRAIQQECPDLRGFFPTRGASVDDV